MGCRIIEYGGEKYKLTPKWYKQYLSALDPLLTTLTPIDKFCIAIHSLVERYKAR